MSNPIEDKRPDERLGAYLARAREAKSMTVAELATATRLSEKNISLIEAGDWKAFQVQAYLRGYLNSISTKLGLDQKRVLDWYAAENGSKFASLLTDLSDGSQNKSGSAEGDKSSKGKAIVIILIVIGLALVVASKFFKDVTPEQSAPEPAKTELVEEESAVETPEMPEGAEVVPADSVNMDSTAASAENKVAEEKTAPVAGKEQGISQAVVDSALKKNSDRPASATIFLSSDSKTEEAKAAPAGASSKLILVASGEMRTWIGIKHNEDDTSFLKESNLSKAGTRMVYESSDTLYVVVGEPRAISKFYLNGKEVPLPGMKFGRVTKFRVFGGKVIEGAE
ncbi:MAG: helix-turn-helix domain-containing protein [Fibrobacter sp.]|nr:helix-turn-helix domain-containing protein [Fibrobacter sp.]